MHKKRLTKVRKLSHWVAGYLTLVALAGCATEVQPAELARPVDVPPADTEGWADAVVNAWMTNVRAENLSALLEIHTADFNDPDVGDRAALEAFWRAAFERDIFENGRFDVTGMHAAVRGDRATLRPIVFHGGTGRVEFGLDLVSTDRGRRISGMDAEFY